MRKLLLTLAVLCGTVSAWAETYDGIYTIGVDANIQRGYLAAGENYGDYPVLSDITWEQYMDNSTTAIENGKNWYITTRDEGATYYIYNVGLGKFLVGTGSQINFGNAPYAWTIVPNGDYFNIGDVAYTDKWLSGGCSRAAANRPIAYDTNENDGGAKHTIVAVEDGTTTFETQIAAADAVIEKFFLPKTYAANKQALFLKNSTTNLYMTITATEGTNHNSGGVQIKAKEATTSLSQVFFLEDAAGQFKIKSASGHYLTAFPSWGYKATATDSDNAKHFIEPSDDTYTLKSTLGYVGSNNDATSDGSWMYSNHPSTNTNIYWTFEVAAESDVVTLQLPEVKKALDAAKNAADAAKTAHTTLTEEQKTSISNAVTFAEAAYASAETALTHASVADAQDAIAAIYTTIDAEIYVWNVNDLSNTVCYTVATESRGAWYSEDAQLNGTVEKNATYSIADQNQQFAFIKSEKGNYYLYSVAQSKFVSKSGDYTTLTETPAQTVSFKESTGASKANFPWVIALDGQYQMGISTGYTPDVITFYNSTSDGGNMVRLEVAASFDATNALTKINTYETRLEKINALETAIIKAQKMVDAEGDALGYYSTSNDNATTDLAAIVEFKNNITDATELDEIEAQIAVAMAITASYTLNLPEAGKFYRFKHPTENAYMLSNIYSENNNRLAMGTLEENKTASVFYYTAEGALLSYAKGQYLPKAVANGNWTCLAVGSEAPSVTFGAGTTIGRLGFYIGDDATRAYYSGNKSFVNAGGNIAANEGYDWVIEEVEWLPVPVNTEVGYATIYSPVELDLSYGRFKAYTATINEAGTAITLTEQSVVPANTGVVLEYQEGATIENGYVFLQIKETTLTDVKSELRGTFADSYVADDAYILAKPEGYAAGFYKAKKNYEDGTKFLNNGFKAYLPKPASSEARFYVFDFGTETGIEGIESENAKAEIYDLSGRRVQNVQKGLYIVNGKKVIK